MNIARHSYEEVDAFLSRHDSLAIFGAGNAGIEMLTELVRRGKHVAVFLDNDASRHGTTFCGIPVVQPSGFDFQSAGVVIASIYEIEIAHQLQRNFRLVPYRDFVGLVAVWPDGVGSVFESYHSEHRADFLAAEACFDDEVSRRLYRRVLDYRIRCLDYETLSVEDLPYALSEWQRHTAAARRVDETLPDSLSARARAQVAWSLGSGRFDYITRKPLRPGDAILDCGGFEGGVAAALASTLPDATIYSFEPVPRSFASIEALRKDFSGIIPVRSGVWSEKTEMTVDDEKPVEGITMHQGGKLVVDLVAIDEFCGANAIRRVHSIKMNIEGAEQPALRGASQTLRRDYPVLGVCLEHRVDDLWRIPLWLREECPEYRLRLEHHGPHIYQTVCIAER
jgi:FkbM family methyltransferase